MCARAWTDVEEENPFAAVNDNVQYGACGGENNYCGQRGASLFFSLASVTVSPNYRHRVTTVFLPMNYQAAGMRARRPPSLVARDDNLENVLPPKKFPPYKRVIALVKRL